MSAHAIMRGKSMEPLLRDGMLLEVSKSRLPAVGEIAVFRAGGRIIAHRVIRRRAAQFICCGDAQPDRIDLVQTADVIGTVQAVYARNGQRMKRIDGRLFRMKGYTLAYLHPLLRLLQRAGPRRRERTYQLLTQAAAATIRDEGSLLLDAVERAAPVRLAEVATRHRMAPALCAALEPLGRNAYAKATFERLRPLRWASAAYMSRYRAQVLEVMRCLTGAGIEFVLLKGAARAFRRDDGWMLYESSDIDLLVAGQDMEPARFALQQLGYTHRCNENERQRYDERHHHAAPLFPRDAGVSVELHRALHSTLLEQTTLPSLRPFLARVHDGELSALVLGRTGTALHYAIHCIDRPALRDVYLLAGVLAALHDDERAELVEALAVTGCTGAAVTGALAMASDMALVPWDTDRRAARFARWMIDREDLPRILRAHCECVDAWLAAERPLQGFASAAFERRTIRSLLGRTVVAAATALYLPFMR